MTPSEQILALREAGYVQRCHTMPYHGPYNVAMHCYGAVCLLMVLHPGQPSIHLIRTVLFHDVAERWTGDMPSPMKKSSTVLEAAMHDIEARIEDILALPDCKITPAEAKWLKAVDCLELWLWTIEQEQLGNRLATGMKNKIESYMGKLRNEFPQEALDFMDNFEWKRLPEVDELLP